MPKHRQPGLTPRQQRFVELYTLHHNATRAAVEAGYSERSAYNEGSRLLTNDEVTAAIAERETDLANQLGLTAQRLLLAQWETYQKAFRGHPKVHDGQVVTYTDPDTGEQREVWDWSPGACNKALETLLRHRGMLTDRHEIDTQGVTYVMELDLGRDLDAEADGDPGPSVVDPMGGDRPGDPGGSDA